MERSAGPDQAALESQRAGLACPSPPSSQGRQVPVTQPWSPGWADAQPAWPGAKAGRRPQPRGRAIPLMALQAGSRRKERAPQTSDCANRNGSAG